MPQNYFLINPRDNSPMNMGYCPYMNVASTPGNFPTLTESAVAAEKRDYSDASEILPSAANGGLFAPPQSTGPWANIPVIPSDTNLTHFNLRSANPPPGATEQYVSTWRLGNNIAPMLNIYWYNPPNQNGMYRMAVRDKKDEKTY